MSNQLANVTYEISGQSIELQPNTVRDYLVRGNGKVTDQEVVMFMNLCQYQQLNPFVNEAYLIKFGQQPAQIIVSKEAFMKRAESSENFAGFEAGIIYEIDDEIKEVSGAIKPKRAELLGGWCKVYRVDRDKPIEVKVSFEEFGKGQATWKEMPMNMIRKVAIVNALREAFPNTLGALYTEEETKKNALDDIPDYKPQERRDITPQQEVIDETPVDPEEQKLKEAKEQMKVKFKQLGITTKKSMQQYIADKAPNVGDNPSLAELIGLLEIMDMDIDMKEMSSSDELD